MHTKSKFISGLPSRKVIIQKPNKYFTEHEKHHVIRDYLQSGESKRSIWYKYTGESEHGILLRWMRELGYITGFDKKTSTFTSNKKVKMSKSGKTNNTLEADFEVLQLKRRVSELEAQLKEAEMKAIAFSTMVDIAEKEFHIPIRKKYNTKP